MRIVTRGMGGGQDVGLVLMGFTRLQQIISFVRGGRAAGKKIYDHLLEEFTIAAKLMEVNGKQLVSPIINKRKYLIDESIDHKVKIEKLNIKKKKEENTNVFATLNKVIRGVKWK